MAGKKYYTNSPIKLKVMSRHYLYLLIILIGARVFTSCTNYTIGQQPIDDIAPDPVKDIQIDAKGQHCCRSKNVSL